MEFPVTFFSAECIILLLYTWIYKIYFIKDIWTCLWKKKQFYLSVDIWWRGLSLKRSDLWIFLVEKLFLFHGQTEGLTIECIYTVRGANNSKVSKLTTSNCMRRNQDWVLTTHTQKNRLDVDTFSCFQHFIWECARPLFLEHGPPVSGRWETLSQIDFMLWVFWRWKKKIIWVSFRSLRW